MTSMRTTILHGLAWTGAGQVLHQVLRLGVGIALARLLSPAEFGLIAMVVMLTGFAEMFLEIGLGAALVQRAQIDETHRSTVFVVTLAAGAALAGLFVLIAPAIAQFFGRAELDALTCVLAVNFIIAGLRCVPLALLTRALRFRAIATIEIIAALTAGCAAIVAAARGWGLWALALHLLLNSAILTILHGAAAGWRPRERPRVAALRQVLGFGAGVLGFRVTDYWSMRIDHLLVGRFIGPASLGVYGKAYELVLFPVRQIGAVVTRVMFPALSSIGDDPARIKRIYLRAVGLIGLVAFPCALGMGAAAESLVLVTLGEPWREMIPLVQILCLVAASSTIVTTTSWLYMARGRADLMFRWGLGAGLIKTLAIVIGLRWGLPGVAISLVVANYAVLLHPSLAIPGRLVGLRVAEILRETAAPFLGALAMAAFVFLLGRALPLDPASPARLGIQVAAGAAVYAALMHALSPGPYRELRQLLREPLGRLRSHLSSGNRAVALTRSRAS